MGSTPQSIQSLLHRTPPDLVDLLGRARFLARMRDALLDVLPEAISRELEVAAYDHYVLRLHVGNAGWATRLRYMDAALKQALAQRMRLQIERIEVKVRPLPGAADVRPPRPRHLSPEVRQHIERSAAFIEDEALAGALRRLAAAGRTTRD